MAPTAIHRRLVRSQGISWSTGVKSYPQRAGVAGGFRSKLVEDWDQVESVCFWLLGTETCSHTGSLLILLIHQKCVSWLLCHFVNFLIWTLIFCYTLLALCCFRAEPLLARIKEDRTVVLSPVFDRVDFDTLEVIKYGAAAHAFDWQLWCMYESFRPEWYTLNDESEPGKWVTLSITWLVNGQRLKLQVEKVKILTRILFQLSQDSLFATQSYTLHLQHLAHAFIQNNFI